MSSSTSPSKSKYHHKANIYSRIERLTLINEIIKLNIPSEQITITLTDLKIFSNFIRTYIENKEGLNYILSTSKHYSLPKSFYHNDPILNNSFSSTTPSTVILRNLIILIIFCNFNQSYVIGDSLIIYKNIFNITKKLFIENIFNQTQLSTFLKYSIVLSSVHSNSKDYNRNGKTIFVWVILFFSIQTLADIVEYNKKHNKEQPTQCLIDVVNFLKNKILSNFHNVDYLKMFSKKIIFSLINQTSPETREIVVSFLSDVYKFSYDKNILTYFLMKFKDILGSIDTDDFKTISNHIEILISHCSFIDSIHNQEVQDIKNDPFTINRCFCFSDSPKNGLEYNVSNTNIIKKEMLMVFSFKMIQNKNDIVYPLIAFYNEETKGHILRIYILNNELYVIGKLKHEQKIVPINKTIETGKTYLVVIEQVKKMFSKEWNVYINGETFSDIAITFPANKFICRVGYDIDEHKDNKENRLNFSGYIGTIILFKKKIDDAFISHLFTLGGNYDLILFLKGKNTNMSKMEKYLPRDKTLNTKYKETIEYLMNNESNINDSIGFYISPLSISQRYVIKPSLDPNKKASHLFIENIFMKYDDLINNHIYIETFDEPSLNGPVYTMEYTYTLSSFVKFDGIRLLTLHIEYYYNILRKRNDINEHILLNISRGLCSVIKTLINIISFVQYNSIKPQCDGFGFSLAKTLSLMLDYQVLNKDLALHLINLLREITNAGTKTPKNKGRTLLACRLFSFLVDPFKYNCNDFNLLGKLFEELNYCIKGNNSLVSIHILKEILKFKFIYDSNEIDKFCKNKESTIDQLLKEYKYMKKKYKGLLETILLLRNSQMFLLDFFNEIFANEQQRETDEMFLCINDNNVVPPSSTDTNNNLRNNNPKHFNGNSMLIKYKLLKIYYLTREKSGLNDCSESSSSSGVIMTIKTGKSAGNITQNKKDDKTHIQGKPLNKYELIDTYLNKLSMFQSKSMTIPPDDKYKTYLELIKAILMRMLFEDIYLLKGEFCTLSIPEQNDKSNNEEEGTQNKKKKVGFNIFNKHSHHQKSSSPVYLPETPDFLPTALSTTFPNVKIGKNKHEDNFSTIEITPPFSMQVLKSIFCCMFDGFWDKCEKLKFIKHHDKDNIQLGEFHRAQKNLLLQYINLITQIENNDKLFYTAAEFICKYLDATLEEFKSNKTKPQSKCKFIHVFESKQIFTTFFMYCISHKQITSNNELQWLYKKLMTYIKYCFIYHPKPFIFPFIYTCISKQVYDINIIIQDLNSFLLTQNNEFWTNYSNDILNDKDEIYLAINEYRYIETFRQVIHKHRLNAFEFFNINNRDVVNSLLKVIEVLFQSAMIYDSNIYFYNEILEHHKRNDIVHCTLYENAIDLLFAIGSLFDIQDDKQNEVTSTPTSEYLNSVLCKSKINGHSICFYLDLYNSSFNYNKKLINRCLSDFQDFNEIEEYTKKQKDIEIKNNIGNKHPFKYAYPKSEVNPNNNLCFICENKLTTIYTYILCVKYCKKIGDIVLNEVISQLQLDLSELIMIIEKYPKLTKPQIQVYKTINYRQKQEIHVYDKIISHLQKNKDSGTEQLNEIINNHITITSDNGLSPMMKSDTNTNSSKQQSNVTDFTSAFSDVQSLMQNDTDTVTTNGEHNDTSSPIRNEKKQIHNDNEDNNDEEVDVYRFYGIYRRDSFSHCTFHCNANTKKENTDNKNTNKTSHKETYEINIKEISPTIQNKNGFNNISVNKIKNRSFIIPIEPDKNIKKYSLLDFDFDEAVICAKRDILLRNFAYFFGETFYINKKFCNMKNQFKYQFKPSDKTNNYFNQQNQSNITYPSKIRNYHNYTSFYPKMFLRPDTKFFSRNNFFTLGHEYYIPQDESIYPDYKIELKHGFLYQPNFNLFSKSGDNNNDAPSNIFACEYNANDNTYYGNIRIRNKYLIFQTDMNFDPKQEYTKDIRYLYSSIDIDITQIPKQIIITYNDIKTIVNRRYVYMNQAIEIFCKNGKSYFFNLFKNEYLLEFIMKLKSQPHRYWNEKILDYSEIYTTFNYKHLIYKEANELSKKWKANKLSTTSYLLQLNKLSGRTYNDINQYPIMPWVLTDYSSNEINNSIRSFDTPISVQKPEKKAKALVRYENSFTKNYHCHFQIHYSNSSFVNSYMVRLAPFTYNQIKFQTNSFDKPNRQFHSFEEFCFLLQEIFDNREMIPEMFLMTEQFYNLNYIYFGRRTSDKGLINIIAGNGVGSTAISFILEHRIILDWPKVANKINQWIDNIFGVNQIPDKVDVFNKYPKECYGKFMVEKFMKYETKYNKPIDHNKWIMKVKAKCNVIISLGQTPCQLFYIPHITYSGEKNPQKHDAEEEFEEFRALSHEQQLKTISTSQKEIYYIGITSEGNYFYLLSKNVIVKYTIAMKEIENISINTPEQIDMYYINEHTNTHNNKHNDNTVMIYNYFVFDIKDGTLFVMCSYHNRGINIYGSNDLSLTLLTDSYVTCLKKVHNKNVFYSGHKNGKICEWEYNEFEKSENFKAEVKYEFIAHEGGVKVITYSDKHDIILSCGEDGKLLLRKMSTYELITIISSPSIRDTFVHAVISDFDVIYAQVYNQQKQKFALYGYTLNGLMFDRTSHSKFLPVDVVKHECNLLFVQGHKVMYVTPDLQKSKETKDIKKAVDKLIQKGMKVSALKGVDECNYEASACTYSLDKNLLYCVIGKSVVLRIPLDN